MSDKNSLYIEEFTRAFKQNLADMAGAECEAGEAQTQTGSFDSQGIAVIVGVTGKRHGRLIIDTSFETALKLSEVINEETGIDKQLVLDTMAEFANIVSGHTTTIINNANKELGLMLTPPSVFIGSKIKIVSPKITAQLVEFVTPVGNVTVSVGFEGGR